MIRGISLVLNALQQLIYDFIKYREYCYRNDIVMMSKSCYHSATVGVATRSNIDEGSHWGPI